MRSARIRPVRVDIGQRYLATRSSSGNALVCSATGELLADLPIQPDGPPALTFVPGSDTLYYEDGNGVIRRFVVDAEETIRLARSLLVREFTPEECARHFPDEPCPRFDL